MSRIVAFIIKNIDLIILFACLVGWLDSSPVEIKKFMQGESRGLAVEHLAHDQKVVGSIPVQ